MGYRDLIREMALLNVLERGDGPETHPASAHARDGHDLAEQCGACGAACTGDLCRRCEDEDAGRLR